MNELFGAMQKLWLFASKTETARLFELKLPRARPSFEPASPLRSPQLKSVHARPAPSKESGSAVSQLGREDLRAWLGL